ncbi:maestro heat-like repeat-containing protein family member 6 [Myiozetetes cayanensis]|uniref:maestro heat-like repeat-containing protein family member 6 n=1 Tax=Myiozetetes cayanensis TaxID=478635 RepID=UPI00215FFAB3|nr:maestro heat-like repeat-containing protein family member 6 [Myiozetetes cayanensis]
MAGGCFGLCGLLRRQRKNRRGPGAGLAQEPEEEVQHFQPLQQDPGRDRPAEQDRARGRFRRAVQRLLKFVGVRRRTATTAPPELVAQPETNAAELEAQPVVSSALSDCAASGDMAPMDCAASGDMELDDGTETSDRAPIDGTATSDMAEIGGTETIDMAATDSTANCDTAPTGDAATSDTAPVDGTNTCDTALMDGTETNDTAPMDDGTATSDTALADTETSSDTAPTDVRAEADATTEGIGNTDCTPMQSVTDAPSLDLWEQKGVSNPNEVPAIVSSIHQWLRCWLSAQVRSSIAIRRLAQAHPGQVVTTLLRCAPACDRAAAILWRTIASSATTVQKVLPTLLGVMEDSVFSSDGNDTDICALAATLALWLMVQEPQCQDALLVHAPRLLVALLCQLCMSTEQMPQEVSTFWRGCQEQHGLPTHPNSFVVQTIKALLCQLQWDQELVSVERKRGWDALLFADTQHYAVGLLAREMRRVLVPSYGPLARHLLGLLSREGPRWELPALALLVELLDYLDVSTCHDSVLRILARHLQSQCPERRRLALRELLVLSVDPSMAKSICSLSEHLLELLRDGDGELVRMTLSIFRNVLQDDEDREGFSPTAPRLAEALRPVFDHDNSHVQLLSIRLFREVMELVAEEGTWLWEMQAWQSLVPLFFRWQDENQRVAEAAREALLWAARFLQRRDLEQLVKTEQHFGFCDCLMEKELSRRGEHLRQALPFLQSPQEPLREAAVRFMGVAGWHMREQQEDLWPILKALEAMSEDDCPSTSNLRNALMATYRSAVRAPRAPLRRPMSLQPLGTTAQGPLPSAAAAPADAGPN